MKLTRPLLLVGKEFGSMREKIVAECREAGIDTVSVATTEDAGRWIEAHAPLAVAVELGDAVAPTTCLRIRSNSHLTLVPILGLAAELTDLTFEEMYGWGGDDVVPVRSTHGLVLRLLALQADQSLDPPALKGVAVVADGDRRRRVLTARVLRNAGYDVRFALDGDEATEASRGEGVKLVVAECELMPKGAVAAVRRAREVGSQVPWVVMSEPKKMGLARSAATGLSKVAITDAFAPPENVLFVANELGRSGLAESRSSPRLLYGTQVAFRLAGRDEDTFGCTYNISAGGLFVRTLAPPAGGDEVWIELQPARCDRRVRMEGRVAWRRRFGPIESATVPPGFGVQIMDGSSLDLARYRNGFDAFVADTIGA